MTVRSGVDVASLTDIGCQRQNNEDSLGYWEAEDDSDFQRLGRLFVVADGMGGCEGGQHASHLAVETVKEVYSHCADTDPQQGLLQAFREAHGRVQQKAHTTPALHGMGTTLTSFVIVGGRLYFAHIGDSRLYLFRGGSLRLLTRDHSLVARLVENGMIRAEEAGTHPQKHVLTAAVGVSEAIEPDFAVEPVVLESGDVLMACTDGLWGQISESELTGTLASEPPSAACRSLIKMARDHGGPDNISVQIARIT